MNVELVDYTRPISGLTMGQHLAHIARVSNPSNQNNHETAAKLLLYCLRNEHWSVFEHAHMTLKIVTSRGIAAQILRHWGSRFQEFSLRYAEAVEFETYPARRQDDKNRQNSIDDLDDYTKDWFLRAQQNIQDNCLSLYRGALDRGIAKEQARFLLPLSTQTTLYMTGNIRSWLHYFKLRTKKGTQLEHKQIAEKGRDILIDLLPEVNEYFEVQHG